MKIKELMKDYEWKDQSLKTKYRICDWGSVALIVGIIVVWKTGMEAMLAYIGIALILIAQWYCFRLKKQDKLLKLQKKEK